MADTLDHARRPPRPARTVRARALAAALVLLACVLVGGCRSRLDRAIEVAAARNAVLRQAPKRERNLVRDPRTGRVIEEWNGLFLGDGTFIRDGVQREWWPEGALRSERWFVQDEPRGLWVHYWRTGALRLFHRHDPDRPTVYVAWHPNGVVAARGMAIAALRVGRWTMRHEHGALRAEGSYAGGVRTGPWVLYGPNGEWEERGSFRRGARVGEWESRER